MVLSHQTRVRIPVALPGLTDFLRAGGVKSGGEFSGVSARTLALMPDKLHERFQIQVTFDDARRRFVNRVHNEILSSSVWWNREKEDLDNGIQTVAFQLGEPYNRFRSYFNQSFETYTRKEFDRTLEALEALNLVFENAKIGEVIEAILGMAEVDLGVRWDGKRFLPSGAKLLDDGLVNDSLSWLREKSYQTVLAPFEKSLSHLLKAGSEPKLLSDVITDAYEALESLAKIVTDKDKTLDANRELFVSKINASPDYKKILAEYCDFAHKFRHGAAAPEKRPELSYAEAESFVYLTGIFIRLVIAGNEMEKIAAAGD